MGEFNVKEDTDPITGEPLLISERRNLYYCQNGTIKNDKTNQEKIDYLMAYYAMDEKERHIFGMNPLMFMESCTFNGKFCSLAQLNFFTDFRYGNCITFNKKKQYMETLRTSEIGPGSGLNVYLNLYKFYYQAIQHTLGIKLIIHDPTEVPSTEDDGVFVGPGFEVLASLKQTINIRLPKPYQDHCVTYDSETKGFAKNKKECIRACIQAKSYETCGCVDQSLGVMNHLKQCDFRNVSESCCLDEVLDSMSHHGTVCSCPLPCFSVTYNEKISKSLLVPHISTTSEVERIGAA
ncbi:degenerin mec-10-like [Argiope bruennichi]|uniref:degenerin mec-10-like n=1 Tax=Argiope bruennichi TaxID=94029 RepID=UPI002494F9FF|nr:degenerin mec-10-like [Argiope bruennichi]